MLNIATCVSLFIYGDELYMSFLYWPVDTVNYIDCFLNIEPTLLHFQDKPTW